MDELQRRISALNLVAFQPYLAHAVGRVVYPSGEFAYIDYIHYSQCRDINQSIRCTVFSSVGGCLKYKEIS